MFSFDCKNHSLFFFFFHLIYHFAFVNIHRKLILNQRYLLFGQSGVCGLGLAALINTLKESTTLLKVLFVTHLCQRNVLIAHVRAGIFGSHFYYIGEVPL